MFKPLTKSNIGGIIELLLADVNKRLEDKELEIRLTDAAKNYVIDHGYEPAYGICPVLPLHFPFQSGFLPFPEHLQ